MVGFCGTTYDGVIQNKEKSVDMTNTMEELQHESESKSANLVVFIHILKAYYCQITMESGHKTDF